jgi:hypothetical protein
MGLGAASAAVADLAGRHPELLAVAAFGVRAAHVVDGDHRPGLKVPVFVVVEQLSMSGSV